MTPKFFTAAPNAEVAGVGHVSVYIIGLGVGYLSIYPVRNFPWFTCRFSLWGKFPQPLTNLRANGYD
jgi:hypothetical protein